MQLGVGKDQEFEKQERVEGHSTWLETKQASWLIRKVMSAKYIIDQIQLMRGKKGSMIRQIYMYMIGEQQRPD
ncbi:hypothetical protein H5410_023073 [Solanum commersonii]|uniref:Uncharacterized protein n=1 Tax=Solanum commersonii TaxID=4109 RepID=A0A9J5ZIQ9_SOLCO|nr:hypothetical protein H5410_023073 [Solanum commersonii]